MNWWKFLIPFAGPALGLSELLGSAKDNWSSIKQGATDAWDFIKPYLSSFADSITGAGLTGAAREQNAFNASEAQNVRDWEYEQLQNKYQWTTQDMQSAGLNPAMMYGGSASTNSASSAPAASGGGQIAGILPQLMQGLSSMQQASSAAKVADAQVNLMNTQSNYLGKEASWLDPLNSSFQQQLNETIKNLIAERGKIPNEIEGQKLQNDLLTLHIVAQSNENDWNNSIRPKLLEYQDALNESLRQGTTESKDRCKKLLAEVGQVALQNDVLRSQNDLNQSLTMYYLDLARKVASDTKLVDVGILNSYEDLEHAMKENERFAYEVNTEIGRNLYSKQATLDLVQGYGNLALGTVNTAMNVISGVHGIQLGNAQIGKYNAETRNINARTAETYNRMNVPTSSSTKVSIPAGGSLQYSRNNANTMMLIEKGFLDPKYKAPGARMSMSFTGAFDNAMAKWLRSQN